MNKEKAWEWLATLWIVAIPCLYYKKVPVSHVQGIAWHLGTVALFAVSLSCNFVYPVKSKIIGIFLICALLAGFVQLTPNAYSILILNSLIAALGFYCLASYAPSSEWLLKRVYWLAVINACYWVFQHTGYDPIFSPADSGNFSTGGFFGRVNAMDVLLLSAIPYCRSQGYSFIKFFLSSVIIFSGNMTAICILLVYFMLVEKSKWAWMTCMASLGFILFRFKCFEMKLLPRISVWKPMLSQCLYSPFHGYGMGAWNQMTPYPGDPYGFNAYLTAFHAGGVLLLAPLLWCAWEVVKSKASYARHSLLMLLGMGLTQDIWNTPNLIMLTIVLSAAFIRSNYACSN